MNIIEIIAIQTFVHLDLGFHERKLQLNFIFNCLKISIPSFMLKGLKFIHIN